MLGTAAPTTKKTGGRWKKKKRERPGKEKRKVLRTDG